MQDTARLQHRPKPQVVSLPVGAERVAGPPGPAKSDGQNRGSAERLLKAMRLVKRARFNAHERLESKHVMSVAAFTFATVFEISLSLLPVVYGASIAPDVRSFIDYAAIVTGLFLFGFGLVVGLANYQTRAVFLQRCAMDLANLAREMEIAMPLTVAELQDFRRRYHEIEARCPFNHSAVDLDRALARNSDKAAVRKAKLGEAMDVYGPYVLAALAYLSLWATFWVMLNATGR
jgi:hypothetical protein